MKLKFFKISCFVVCIVVSILANAQKPKEKSKQEKINFKQIEAYKVGREKKEKETNIIRAKYDENFTSNKYKNPDSIALEYLKEKHSYFGLSENLNEVRIKKVNHTPGGKYVYFEQHFNNIPVYLTTSLVALNKGDTVTYVLNNFKNLKKYSDYKNIPILSNVEAINLAKSYLQIQGKIVRDEIIELIYFESIDQGMELAWKINIVAMNPLGDWLVVINALNKRIIHIEDIAMYHNGSGMIYNPNPVASGNTVYGGNFVDNSDANNTTLSNERIQVTLRDITFDEENEVYSLEGPYCVLEDLETPIDNFPELANPNEFNYTRDQQEFESVMVYYHIDLASRRVEALGYNNSDLKTFSSDPHGLDGADNSHYMPSQNYVAYGEGGVDDAEDADVIWHEFGHALQWNLGIGYMPSVGETMSVKEGSSDYWAVSYKRSISSYNWGLWANWDGHNEFWDGRRADLDWVYPDDYVGGHEGGQIWSSALMRIWSDLGRDITDRLFLETHFLWGSTPSLEDAAEAFIQADRQLYGGSHVCKIIELFRLYGLTDLDYSVVNVSNRTITLNETITGCDVNISNVKVENNSKLTIDAVNNVNIIGEIEIKIGSEFEIK